MATTKSKASAKRSARKPAPKSAPKRVREFEFTKPTEDARTAQYREMLDRIEALVTQPVKMGIDRGAGEDITAIHVVSNAEQRAMPAEREKLPSHFQIDAPVFVRFGDQFVPGVVSAVQFECGSVYYGVRTVGPLVPQVWSGYVVPRDSDVHSTVLDGPTNTAGPVGKL